MTVDDFQGVSGTLRAHPDPGCAIFVRDYFKWSVFGSVTKYMGSSKTNGLLKNSWAHRLCWNSRILRAHELKEEPMSFSDSLKMM